MKKQWIEPSNRRLTHKEADKNFKWKDRTEKVLDRIFKWKDRTEKAVDRTLESKAST
ncbi:hypothetical protein [Lysinibacillus sp. SG55]|uniref:hypothetical protein n=1 Tax=Lysinibacillus sp. SG55 TaxID=1500270 RepID=UPI00147D05FB|nr:hypothetical protein [Lysinibacillus sp. SG55]